MIKYDPRFLMVVIAIQLAPTTLFFSGYEWLALASVVVSLFFFWKDPIVEEWRRLPTFTYFLIGSPAVFWCLIALGHWERDLAFMLILVWMLGSVVWMGAIVSVALKRNWKFRHQKNGPE